MARMLCLNLFLLGAALLLIGMPFYHEGMPLWIGAAMMSLGALVHFLQKRPTIFSAPFIGLLLVYWLLQVVGTCYTPAEDEAWAKVFVKISLVLLPASAFLFSDMLSKTHIVLGLNLFHLSCFSTSIFHLVKGMLRANETGRSLVFYEEFSVLMHPAYLSLMLCCVIIIGLYMRAKDHWGAKILGAYYKPISTVVLLSTIFLLSSRIQMLAIFTVLLILAVVRLANRKARLRAKSISVIVLLLALVIGATVIKSNHRIGQTLKELREMKVEPGYPLTSISVRVVAWQICWQELLKSPILGNGTASSKTLISTSEMGSEHPQLAGGGLGAHNQYLTEAIDHGLIGLLLLLLITVGPMARALKNKNAMLFGVTAIIAISLTTESMFEREAGVFIYAMLMPLTWLYKRRIGFA